MRLTPDMLALELRFIQALNRERQWRYWTDPRDRRDPTWPTILALHATGITLAIYIRPRKPYPSDKTSTQQIPEHWKPVIWHPGNARNVETWLTLPTTLDLPGAAR